MRKVGLTGGMGSGKSTVAGMFTDLGIPVYNSDLEAKRLMNQDEALKKQIIALLGKAAYQSGVLNRSFIAEKVFNNRDLLKKLNKIVHPAVREDFRAWAERQTAPYVLQEAAILFENGSSGEFDAMILVTAPKKIRIKRILERDGLSESAIRERMKHQWSEKKKKALAHFVIENTDLDQTREAVQEIHKTLIKTGPSQQF